MGRRNSRLVLSVALMAGLVAGRAAAHTVDLSAGEGEFAVTGPFAGGDATESRLPRAMAAGDFDGDGQVEVAVSTAGGEVVFVSGRALLGGHLDTSGPDVLLRIRGGERYAGFGESLAAGDFDGDGRSDLIIGAPEADRGTDGGHEGAAIILRGRSFHPRDVDLAVFPVPGIVVWGVEAGGRLGKQVVMADFDGDGLQDAAVSAPYAEAGAGRVYFFKGGPIPEEIRRLDVIPPDGVLIPPAGGRLLGWNMAAGDYDGDGLVEIAVTGRRGPSGFISLVGAAMPGERIISPDASWLGTGTGELAVPVAADLDGDARDELVAGLNGRIWIVKDLAPGFGPADISAVAAGGLRAPQGSGLGEALAAGDVDGDGRDEVLVGAPRYDPDPDRPDGGVAGIFDLEGLIPAHDAFLVHRLAFVGAGRGDALGSTLLVADLDGDGLAEALVGSPHHRVLEAMGDAFSFLPRGRVDVAGGGRTGILDLKTAIADGSLTGAPATAQFWPGNRIGRDVARGDFDGDGLDDVAVLGQSDVWVFQGGRLTNRDMALLPTAGGVAPRGRPASGVETGDVNGDGRDDLLVVYADEAAGGRGEVAIFLAGPLGFPDYRTYADAAFIGQPGDRLGVAFDPELHLDWTTVAVGDLDGDGVPDLAVGAPSSSLAGFTPSGRPVGGVWVLYGPLPLGPGNYVTNYTGDSLFVSNPLVAGAGSSVDLGDRNGDGADDLVVGSSRGDAVYVLDGGTRITGARTMNAARASLTIRGFGWFGSSVLFADTDGDGRQEIVAGAPRFDGLSRDRPDAGGVAIFQTADFLHGEFAATDAPLGTRLFIGAKAGDHLGVALDASDVDGDGEAEVAALLPAMFSGNGAVAGLDLIPFHPIVDLLSDPPVHMVRGGGFFPMAQARFALADTDADGRADVAVGFPDFTTPAPPRLQGGAVAGAGLAPGGCPPLELVERWVLAIAEGALDLGPDQVLQDGTDVRLLLALRAEAVLDDVEAARTEPDLVHRLPYLREARDLLLRTVLKRFDGCAVLAAPDATLGAEDWVLDCEAQGALLRRSDATERGITCHIDRIVGAAGPPPLRNTPIWEGDIR